MSAGTPRTPDELLEAARECVAVAERFRAAHDEATADRDALTPTERDQFVVAGALIEQLELHVEAIDRAARAGAALLTTPRLAGTVQGRKHLAKADRQLDRHGRRAIVLIEQLTRLNEAPA